MHRDKATALLWQNETFQAHIAKTATAGEDVTDVDVFCAAAYLGTTIYVYQKPGENGAWTWSRYGPEIQLLKQCQIPKGTHEDIVHLCCLNDEVDAHNYKLFEAAKSRVEYVTVPANERAVSSGTVDEQDLKSVLYTSRTFSSWIIDDAKSGHMVYNTMFVSILMLKMGYSTMLLAPYKNLTIIWQVQQYLTYYG